MIIVLLIAMFIILGIYLYFFFLRALSFFKMERKAPLTRLLALLLLVCVLGLVFLLSGIGMIIIFNFILVSLFVDFANFFVKKILEKREHLLNKWRKVYQSGIAVILITLMIMGYGFYNGSQVVNTTYDIETSKNLDKLQIVMISDLHMGTTMDPAELSSYCKEIQKKKPDLLVLVGDIFDESTPKEYMEEASRILGGISCKYGTYFVYGNHDKGVNGENSNFTQEECEANLKENHIDILEDERILIDDRFYLIGRKDASFTKGNVRESIETLTEDIDKSKYLILLDHQPLDLEENAHEGIDLQLSGHTHGDQIWPLGFFSELFGINEMVYGIKQIDDYKVIVSSGMGCWGSSVRTGTKSEIVWINITTKQ